MARSVWKGPFVDGYLLKKAEKAAASRRNDVVKIWSRGLRYYHNLLALHLVFTTVRNLSLFPSQKTWLVTNLVSLRLHALTMATQLIKKSKRVFVMGKKSMPRPIADNEARAVVKNIRKSSKTKFSCYHDQKNGCE